MTGTFYLLRAWLGRSAAHTGLTSQTMLFFVMALTACVFALGSDNALLMHTMPAMLWVIMLLASLLGLHDLLARDARDGTLDDMVLSPHSLPKLMALKLLTYVLASGLPLAAIAPLILLAIDTNAIYDPRFVFIGLALGAFYFAAIGLVAASLALGARRNVALYAAIVLPLSLPGLIFGAGGFSAIALGLDNRPAFYLLAAITVAFVTLSPFASAFIVRMKVSS